MRVADPFRPPPPHASRFRSDHLDEIHAFIAAYDGSHRRAALGTGPLGYSIDVLHCGDVDLGWAHTRVRQRIRGVPQGAILHLPLERRHVYAVGGRTLEARPDTAILLAPQQEYTFYFEPGDCLVALRLPGFALAEELAARDRTSASADACTREIALAGDRLGALAALQRALVDAAPSSTGGPSPAAKRLQAQLCSWLSDQILGTRPASSTPALAVRRVRMVEEWVDAHLADPITLGRLCAGAGVGDRHLEAAFRAHRGHSPLQFVMARRLAHVRRNLLDSRACDTVTRIVHEAGFVHLGRFAARYRRAYGESPSATLKRAEKGRGSIFAIRA